MNKERTVAMRVNRNILLMVKWKQYKRGRKCLIFRRLVRKKGRGRLYRGKYRGNDGKAQKSFTLC